MRVFFFFILIVALSSCDKNNGNYSVKVVPIKESFPVVQFEYDNFTAEHVNMLQTTTLINSQEELISVFNAWKINDYDDMNEVDYKENTLLVIFFYSFNLQPVLSVKHQLYYHEDNYYQHYFTLESTNFKETDTISFYYTGIVIKKIDDNSSIQRINVNIVGEM